MIVGCIIQGDIRENFNLVCNEIAKHFDVVIVSTWESEILKIQKKEHIHYIFSKPPKEFGYSNRNLQRISTSKGIKLAKQLNCNYVLKWRTDMLPLKLDVGKLVEYSNFNPDNYFKSRIVTCAFRNLTVKPDWFSSIPDLFSFGHIDFMELMWSETYHDYSKKINYPIAMIDEVGSDWLNDSNIIGNYCAETELYAFFKSRIIEKTNNIVDHETLAKNYFYLINHKDLDIIWFGNNRTFRPILSLYYPWWTRETWLGVNKVKVLSYGYPANYFSKILLKIRIPFLTYLSNLQQKYKLKLYLKKNL